MYLMKDKSKSAVKKFGYPEKIFNKQHIMEDLSQSKKIRFVYKDQEYLAHFYQPSEENDSFLFILCKSSDN